MRILSYPLGGVRGDMHYKKPTRKDVARLAGVSEPTVSYVINKSRRFSEDIENRVHQAIKTLNYEPNAACKKT